MEADMLALTFMLHNLLMHIYIYVRGEKKKRT